MRVKKYTFRLVNIECLPTSVNLNVIMELDNNIEDLLPYIAARLPGCTYIHGSKVVNYPERYHIIAFHPEELTITRVKGKDDAWRMCEFYKDFINETNRLRQRIKPVYMKRVEIGPLDIFKVLPGTNCGDCGYPTCLAFAARVVRRETNIRRCIHLFEKQDQGVVKVLLSKLREAGIDTDEDFQGKYSPAGVVSYE